MLYKDFLQILSRNKTRVPLIIIISVEIALVFSLGFFSPKLFQHKDDALATKVNAVTEGKGNEVKAGKGEDEKTRKQVRIPCEKEAIRGEGSIFPKFSAQFPPPFRKGGSGADSLTSPPLAKGGTKVSALERKGEQGGFLLSDENNLPPSVEPPKVAIIIDDFGNHTKTAYAFFDLDGPLNCAFLPKRPFTKKSIELAKEKGHQIMLHLPMEPYRSHITNPGNLAVWTYMTDEDIRKTVIAALDAVSGAIGADNHMGSKAMEDERVITAVLKVFKERNLFFIDSETTAKTVLNKVAKNLSVKTRANRVFLDNEKELSYVIKRIRLLGDIAIRDGEVIGIGHVNTVTALALKVGIPLLKRRGIKLVSVSELLR